ncbi:MAG: hypothetical protein PHH01_01270 [Patescibacteria group bacterium]|nr:hypothetical protein [Patescibacteria group bacterium]
MEDAVGHDAVQKTECPHCKEFKIKRRTIWAEVIVLFIGVACFAKVILTGSLTGISPIIDGLLLTFSSIAIIVSLALIASRLPLPKQYVFLDTSGKQHIHKKLFAGGYAGVTNSSGEALFVDGYVFEMRQSFLWHGCTRILQVTHHHMHPHPLSTPASDDYVEPGILLPWRMTWFRNDHQVHYFEVMDDGKNRVRGLMEEILWMFRTTGVLGAINTLRRDEERLNGGIRALEDVIVECKETLGKSRHAQFLREQLELLASGQTVTLESARDAVLAYTTNVPGDASA